MEPAKSSPSWGKTVELLRRLREWRQDEVAERAGVSLSALSAYETGQREPPDGARAAVERALGVAGWMEEAQTFLGYLRRAMEWPVDLGAALEEEVAERAAQVEILLRAGVAGFLGSGNSSNAGRSFSHGLKNSENGRRNSSHGPKNSDQALQNSSHGLKNSQKGPRNSSRAPKNSEQGS